MNPFANISARVIGAVIGAIVVIVGLSLLVHQCDVRRSKGAQSRVNQAQGAAFQNSASDAVNTAGNVSSNQSSSEDLTRSNGQQIHNAEGANDKVNPASRDAGISSLCRRKTYATDPRCKHP